MMRKKITKYCTAYFLIVILLFGMVTINGTTKVSAIPTKDAAIVHIQSLLGTKVGSGQCVALIQHYYEYLGVSRSYGNGSDYATNTLPAGWSRVQGGSPQKGDILVYTGGTNNYGHVAIYESDTVTYHQNYNNNQTVQKVTNIRYNGFKVTPYWGYIRPNWNVHTHSYVSSITSNPTCTNAGVRTYRCSCGNSYTESIPATGHKYNNTKVEPTLTADGYTLHTCSVCGNSYTDQVVKAPQKKDDGWYYCSSMPKEVTTQDYTIEYNNHFEKVAASSPGAGWTQAGVVKDEWQNSGAQYETQEDLTTSNERVLVRSVYYHFCGPSTGNSSNHSQTSSFVHYDSVDANSVNPTYVGVDEGYNYFYLYWKSGGEKVFCQSGVTCDGSYGSHGKRNCTWYKTNVYQNRVHVVQYKYTKDSGWGNEIAVGGSATTTYRFKAIEKQEDTSGDASKDTTADPKQDVTSENDSTKNETPANTTTEQPKKNVTSNVTTKQPSTNTTQVSTKKVLSKVKGLKLAAKKYGIVRVNWKKVKGASYYKIQISKKKSFKGAKSYTCNTTKYALWGLKKKKKYYVRVRAYSENDVAGAYCKAKRVKVK